MLKDCALCFPTQWSTEYGIKSFYDVLFLIMSARAAKKQLNSLTREEPEVSEAEKAQQAKLLKVKAKKLKKQKVSLIRTQNWKQLALELL